MTDGLSTLYQDLLGGSYDCVDRIVLNAYFRMGHDPGGFRVWWRALTGSDETLENAYLMRLAGRFSRRIRGYAKAHGIPVIDCSAGQRKHDLAEEYLAETTVTQGLFLVLVGRAQAVHPEVRARRCSAGRSALVPAALGGRVRAVAIRHPTRGCVRTEDARAALQQRRPRILMAVPRRERAAPKLLYPYGGTESLNLPCSDSEVGLLSERLRREPRATWRQHYRGCP